MNLSEVRLGMVGVGNMGSALVRGIVRAKILEPRQITAFDPATEKLAKLASGTGIEPKESLAELAEFADTVLLCVKPQVMKPVLDELRPDLQPGTLFISIAAGVTTAALETALVGNLPVVRVMPNTPAMVSEGVSALCAGHLATEEHLAVAETLLGGVGRTVRVAERLMDAVTGLSGSGPAYIFLIAEALADAGVDLGLDRATAVTLVFQTIRGAGVMLTESGLHPAALKNQVTSPGGTTARGLQQLELGGLRAILVEAVRAAAERSAELAQD